MGINMIYCDGVLNYQKETLDKLLRMSGINSLHGMNILEVGGSGDMAMAKSLALASSNHVVVMSPFPWTSLSEQELRDANITLIEKGAEDSGFEDKSFDLIFGCAVLEHIKNIDMFFSECYRLLKPYGWIMLQGGPHWYSKNGHHLYANINGTLYTFHENNPIPEFSHLIMEKDELSKFLRGAVPRGDVDQIIYEIYDHPHINRLGVDYIIRQALKYSWIATNIATYGAPPKNEIMQIVSNRHSSLVGPENLYLAFQRAP